MTQEVAQILKVRGYLLHCRGTISVKGKGDMVTYFLEGNSPKEWISSRAVYKIYIHIHPSSKSRNLQVLFVFLDAAAVVYTTT